MQGFNIRAWYKGGVAAAVPLIVGGMAAGQPAFAYFGLGMLLLSWGEWINHPFQSHLAPGYVIEGEARRPCLFGGVLGVLGVVIMLIALARLTFAIFE